MRIRIHTVELHMEHLYHDLGYLQGGKRVEVSLSAQANVKLLDASNYANYKAGRAHRYHGGHVTTSPFSIAVPSTGHWFVAIDLGGRGVSISSRVRVLG